MVAYRGEVRTCAESVVEATYRDGDLRHKGATGQLESGERGKPETYDGEEDGFVHVPLCPKLPECHPEEECRRNRPPRVSGGGEG